jgi:hypothetical protein
LPSEGRVRKEEASLRTRGRRCMMGRRMGGGGWRADGAD